MNITANNLVNILGIKSANAVAWVDALNETLNAFEINTINRVSAFIAQVGHESARLTATVENLNYSASALLAVFPKYFDTNTAASYARQPEKIANRVYANRMGNGPETSGEGWKYRGRGLIQITGKLNYVAMSNDLGSDFITNPDLVSTPEFAALSAGWFWNSNNLNILADGLKFTTITQRINGGQNGAPDRLALYQAALKEFNS